MGGRRGACVGNGLTPRAGVAKAMTPGGVGKNQQGFTIIELMISLAIAGVVMGALYSLFISQQKVLGVQDQDAEMHQAARAAMDAMVREFRMIGYGVPNSSWDGCAAPCPPTKITSTTPPPATSITFRGNLDATRTTLAPINPPTIMNHACVTYLDLLTRQCTATGGLTILTVDSASGFKVGDTIYVEGPTFDASPYSTHWHTATVTATTATTLTISAGLNFDYVRGSTVHVVKTITYSFDTSEKQIQRCVSAAPPCGATNTQPLAENINALTLSYVFEKNVGTSAPPWALPDDADGDTTNDTSAIRIINIGVTARTPRPDPAYKQNSGYRLVTVTSQVTVRNLP